MSSNFPSSNLLVRNPIGDTVRSLYMVNDVVKSIVQHNDYARIRLMTAGTKVFGKQEGAEAKRAAARGQCWTDVAFWGGVVPGNQVSRAMSCGCRC